MVVSVVEDGSVSCALVLGMGFSRVRQRFKSAKGITKAQQLARNIFAQPILGSPRELARGDSTLRILDVGVATFTIGTSRAVSRKHGRDCLIQATPLPSCKPNKLPPKASDNQQKLQAKTRFEFFYSY